ncbi:anhydro-N-acetylmuramic acid kinase [Streptomyces aureoverticillatus]|uniref:anhydro-N-acetylmuramic acid kinase n=1 Tax=Streptomyces aureoverticillatus TaxID=66871 RepID=UPI0013DB1472|nr:anhydro-N-acetylmuramic acid kinase [Streptomyces aureoverticillatus]QIB42536.1 anhydro-N-acetylmuramic acid kinase [Streptomyces aureoverticillatus]
MRVIGLMSGTSHDAIDAGAVDLTLDGDSLHLTPLGVISRAYDDDLRTALTKALPPSRTTMADVCRLDTRIGQAFAAAATEADRELCDGRAELVASHGQTVFHWVAEGRVHGTLQIGQAAWIAEATGLPVVADFRPRDVAAGGQGAPLVSLVDQLWLRGRPGTPIALNLGGIANITAPDGTAFDTGPANALIDAAVYELTPQGREQDLTYDKDGEIAARGTVHGDLLARLLAEPYYALPAPKTTGKELFHPAYLRRAIEGYEALAPEDVVATLTRLTAVTVADAVRTAKASEVVASGGGIRNPVLMAALRAELGPGVPVRASDELGLASAAKEAYAFAVLGFLTVHGLPGTVAASTGARHASVLGSLTPGRTGLRLPGLTEDARPPRQLVVDGH